MHIGNRDMDVFEINPGVLKKFENDARKLLTKKERKTVQKIAKEFREQLCVMFSHSLKRGWEKKILNQGKVLTKGGEELFSVKTIKEAMDEDGEIQFFSHDGNSPRFITSLQKKLSLENSNRKP